MDLIETKIKDVKLLKPKVFGDSRGYFMETWREEFFRKNIFDKPLVQDNQSSSTIGVLRGLHYQTSHTQGKLVRVLSGKVFDVAVDLRKSSPTFGQYVGVELSDANKLQFWVPEGFAHGFLVLSDIAEFCYKCDDYYHPNDEGGIAWNDPDIGIEWPGISGNYNGTASAEGYFFENGISLNLSEKDQKWLRLRDTIYV